MGFKTIIPANDWFFIHKVPMAANENVQTLAAFALTDEGTVIGLIPVGAKEKGGNVIAPQLTSVPALSDGRYVHLNDLTETQRELAGIK